MFISRAVNKVVNFLALVISVKQGASLPASAGGQRGGGDVADGGRLQSGGGRAGAHVEQLRLSRDIFGRPVEQT